MRAVCVQEVPVESFLKLQNPGNFPKKYWFGDSRCPAYSLLIPGIFQPGFSGITGNSGKVIRVFPLVYISRPLECQQKILKKAKSSKKNVVVINIKRDKQCLHKWLLL